MRHIRLATLLAVFLSTQALGEDWPQWRGPDRSDVSRETNLLDAWPKEGPQQQWLFRDAGLGYSGPAIARGRIYLMGARKKTAYLIALDAATGTELWKAELGPRFDNNWGNGPRATPTVDGDFVYGMSAHGDLVCARCDNGDVVWRSKMEDLGGEVPNWGYTESVLVDGKHVVCTPGGDQGAIAALDKRTGKLVWRSEECTEPAQYSSIVPLLLGNQRHYVQLFSKALVGVAPKDGRILWQTDWDGNVAVIPTPVVARNQVFVTSGYGAGCMLTAVEVKSNQPQATSVYRNKVMKNHHGGVILFDGHLYGYSDGAGWLCQNFQTGETVWKERKQLGKGAVACADGKLYCLDEETGDVVLVDASPNGWKEHGRMTLKPQTRYRKREGGIWTHPVISNGKLYLRDQELFFCFDIAQ